jgi:EmrB/QacA subfamily drug resistance transporter
VAARPVRARRPEVPFRLVFAILLGSVTAFSLLQSLVIPVLPTIERGLHTSQRNVTWVLTAYLLSAAVCTPIIGRVGDAYGKERMLVVALAGLALGCVTAALASSLLVMIIARLVQGVGGAVMPLSFGILRDKAPPHRVAGAIGVVAAMTAVGGGFAIVLAGFLVRALDYHWLFWLPLFLIVPCGLAVKVWLRGDPPGRLARPSVAGGLALSGWLVCLLLAISEGPSWGWTDPRVLALLGAAVALAVLWIVVEYRAPEPLVDMAMMRRRAVWTTNLVALLFGVGMYAAFAFLPQYVQTPSSSGYGFGASITGSGLFLLPLTTTMFLTALLAGRVAAAFGSRLPVIVGSGLAFGALLLLTLQRDQPWKVCVATGLLGVGFGLAYAAMSNLIVDAVPSHQTGVASGMNANIRTIGGSVGTQLMAGIVTAGVVAGALPPDSGYTRGFAFLAFSAALAAVAAAFIPRPHGMRAGAGVRVDHAELAVVASGTLTEGELSLGG